MTARLMQTASRVAIAAAAGVLASQALAADLGGSCCVDLEERVAELEATAARKGTRRMGLQISGQVSEAVIFWDDGAERNVYVAENNGTQNRIIVAGSAKINSEWAAGYKLEWQIRAFRSSGNDQRARGDNEKVTSTVYNTRSLSLKHAHWYLRSEKLGTFTVGQQSDSANGIVSINLAEPDGFAGTDAGYANRDFRLRRSGTVGNAGLSTLTWRDAFFRNGDGPVSPDYTRATSVRYQTPTFMGFNASASWGEDDMWSVGLRYSNEFNGVRIAAGVGYMNTHDDDRNHCSNLDVNPDAPTVTVVDCHSWQAGISILHRATGLYVTSGWAQITDELRRERALLSGVNPAVPVGKDDQYWLVQVGWIAKLNSLGDTTFWVDYQEWDSGFGMRDNNVTTVAGSDILNPFGATAFISDTKTNSWGLGVTQSIDNAAMNIYSGFRNFSTDITMVRGTTFAKSRPIDDMQVFYTGATVRF